MTYQYTFDLGSVLRPLEVPCRKHYDLAIADIGTTEVAHPVVGIDRNGGGDGWVIGVFPTIQDLTAGINSGGTRNVSDAGVVTVP